MQNPKEIFSSDRLVLVDFFAEWCGPCKMMAPVLKELKEHYGDSIHIVKIDIDKTPNLNIAEHHKVQSIPTLILMKNNEVLWRNSGAMDADSLKKLIDSYI
ncbi:MAG: thioredoxin [Rikenellaceae bacterium]|nr:thioredoxin [Rikenellaceae bacterium]